MLGIDNEFIVDIIKAKEEPVEIDEQDEMEIEEIDNDIQRDYEFHVSEDRNRIGLTDNPQYWENDYGDDKKQVDNDNSNQGIC